MLFHIGGPRPREGGGRTRPRLLAGAVALGLVAPLAFASAAEAQPGGFGRPDVRPPRVSKVKAVNGPGAKEAREQVAKDAAANAEQARRATAEQGKGAWPKAGSAKVELTAAADAGQPKTPGRGKALAGGLPLAMAPAVGAKDSAAAGTQATVTVLDQQAADRLGILGVVLTATAPTAGKAQVSVAYGEFASAIGGGWSGRLELVRLPACALTSPEKQECRSRTRLGSVNDTRTQTVSASVPLAAASSGMSTQTVSASSGATVLALTAGSPGAGESAKGSGDYSATELAESSSWSAGSSSGAFTWSYDFKPPAAAAGPAPTVSLAYDSGSIDGRTATTNNQGTSVGEGFGITESYVERGYGSCDDDGHDDVFDLCWKYDNARLVLNGKSSTLVKDKVSGAWRLQGDDASVVTRSTGADNGDDNGEHWTVVTGDGSKYVFGLNKLDGAAAERTNSVWTAPVFGDDSGEPGYSEGTSFAGRSLTQAWRWNLDYVEDTRGNAATYWYTTETNHYRKNKAAKADTPYVRGGYLKEVKYGLRKGALFTDAADAKVTFDHKERCTASDCAELTKDTADNWPDVPFDAICSEDDAECDGLAPSFFTRKRLTGINTFTWASATSSYDPVDSWELVQEYLDGGDIGDTSDQVLTLKSLKRTAKAGTAVPMDPVSFTYHMRPNRVDGTDDILPLTRPRVSTVTSETGAVTRVTMSAPECVRSEVLGAAEDTNTRNCFPQYWNINGSDKASVDWFHKYRVLAVVNSDPAGQNDGIEQEYSYSGAAWHYSDSPFTPQEERTWSDWRGYRQVTVLKGAKDAPARSKTVSLYLQGMDGDRKKDGSTKSVSVPGIGVSGLAVPAIADSGSYSGQLRQQITYSGATPVGVVVNEPWAKETARQEVPGAGDQVARYVRTHKATTHTFLTAAPASKAWRSRTRTTDHDEYGMPYQVQDGGDDAVTGDETCTRTWFARNTTAGLTNLPSRTRTVGKACSVTDAQLDLPAESAKRGDVLSDTAISYDGAPWSAAQQPSKGLPTWTGRAAAYNASDQPSWQEVSTTGYDALGRPLSVTDADKKATTTEYTPPDAGPVTRTAVTNAKGHKTITFFDPRRGLPLRTFDPNARKTELAYDAVGRLTDVWLPNRNRAAGYSPNQKFGYQLSNSKPSAVSTSVLKKDGTTYNTTYSIYDALLRPLQSQSPTPQGGRVLTDTRYDSRGLAYETHADIFDNTTAPNATYTRAEYGESPTQTEVVFDGAGRETQRSVLFFGTKRWTVSTTHTGDSVATTALAGGSARRVIVDALGRTVETRSYAGTDPADAQYGGSLGVAYTSVKTGFTPDGKENTITGPDGAAWTYGYDLFGRRTTSVDPDKGKAVTDYNALDQVVKTTDARLKSVLTAYDEIGRITHTWAGSATDANLLTSQGYDSVVKGKPSSSTRYVGGKTGQAYTREVTAYDSLDRATATRLKLPATDPLVKAGAPASIDFTTAFNNDGTKMNSTEPALGGLESEIVGYDYTSLGQVKSIVGSTGYLLATDYSALGQAQQLILGTANTEANKKIFVTNTYEEGTGRLTRSHVTDQTHPYMLQDLTYSFDQVGNVTEVADPTTLGGTGKAETQCFAYDGFRRLTEAWTPSSRKCADPRKADSLSGPAPYWTGYTYDTAGQRKSETEHKAGGDVTTTSCFKTAQPHTLRGTSTKNDCAAPEQSYVYDAAGNTVNRPGATGTQTLDWGTEGKLDKVTEGAKATDYLYDADGNLLIRSEKDGERVLYAGGTELHLKADGKFWAQRFYGTKELTVAVRSNQSGANKVHYLAGDRHGTSSLAIASDTQAVTKRYLNAFGEERGGGVGSWVDDRGFLGKTQDKSTGLTHVDAREYDAALGRFISADPLLEPQKHQSLNGYGYAESNPVTSADPSGQASFTCTMGVDCDISVVMLEMFVSPPLWGSSSTGTSGSSWGTSQGFTGSAGGSSPLLQRPPLLLGPDPVPLQFTGQLSPEMQKIQKMFLEAQAMCRPPSGELANDEHGGDGKVNSDGPWSLALRWIWGSPEMKNTIPNGSYDGDDKMTQALIKSSSMKDVREQVAAQFNETGKTKGQDKYSVTKTRDGEDLNLLQMAGVYASDLGGLILGKDDREAQGVLGSYDVKYNVTKSKGNTLTVQYHAWTDIDNESFAPGHGKWQQVFNKTPQYTGGYFAGYRVDLRWTETIYK
ncbi:RHS repeat-associated core domain-containing protein [Streptomyces xanthophaeus]|uniref:RHS repeat domain-containing protein n=1 Tax=Streptomyces xanthophaeus TaxID=67385 RepID=UPI00398FFFE0